MTETRDRNELIDSIKHRFEDVRCVQVEQMLSIMSNPLRFHILCALTQGPFTVSELVEVTEAKHSNMSQQLKMMTLAGYLEKSREGKQIIYRLKDHRIFNMIHFLEEMFG
jgi:DNA-binding transcriptional ArsR family regulator